eukprot:COSAG03_NODE_2813_length_2436_cov_15.686778_2_plen_51_part_00
MCVCVCVCVCVCLCVCDVAVALYAGGGHLTGDHKKDLTDNRISLRGVDAA